MVKIETQEARKQPLDYQIFEFESEEKYTKKEFNQEKVEKNKAWRGINTLCELK